MIILICSLSTNQLSPNSKEKIEHCFSCVFKKNLSVNGLSIKLSTLCPNSNMTTISIFYKKDLIINTTFNNSLDSNQFNIKYTNDITVQIEQDGARYIFYKRSDNTMEKNKRKIFRITSAIVIIFVFSVLFALLVSKKCNTQKLKSKRRNVIVVSTPTHSEMHTTKILSQ
ncbi:Hypothetical_protein [Hexamita inflata]|uniref:Hypothetical_protein n=1 Tax=Hexamita inflata TaxID=28002 RepID=A0AA86V6I9_9EUKA|nr:Hypothetical protein HINF_LOCUS66016 [Hexamita inflata]